MGTLTSLQRKQKFPIVKHNIETGTDFIRNLPYLHTRISFGFSIDLKKRMIDQIGISN